eukprot:5749191-Prorocentrum_lima.AAC.1
MTSSLVGSEMCIRDRDWKGGDMATIPKVAGVPTCKQHRGISLMESLSTVSYTHLTLPTICSV